MSFSVPGGTGKSRAMESAGFLNKISCAGSFEGGIAILSEHIGLAYELAPVAGASAAEKGTSLWGVNGLEAPIRSGQLNLQLRMHTLTPSQKDARLRHAQAKIWPLRTAQL
jgi:hypothetical protein